MYTRVCCVVYDAAYVVDTISCCYSDLCGLCIP